MTTPFTEPYPDPRTPRQRERESAAVAEQVRGLVDLQRDDEARRALVGRLSESRSRTGLAPIEAVAVRDGEGYVAGGEALVPRGEITADTAGRIAELGLRLVDDDPASPFLRLVDLTDRRRAADLITAARENGLPSAGFHYLVPLGGVVMKAGGGPEPSVGGIPFPSVTYPTTGTAPLVAVLDTGVSLEQRTDGYLQGLVEPDNVDPLDVLPFPGGDGFLELGAGHGSAVTSDVQQVAPTARLRVYKVTAPDGLATDTGIATAIRRAVAEGADIVNLSLGTPTEDDQCPPAMRAAVADTLAANPDLVFTVAAGNDGTTTPIWPAALSQEFDRVVSVAGLDAAGGPSAYSSHGPWVTCSAIGQGVVSCYVIGAEDGTLVGDPDPDVFGPDSWVCWTGSSFAAPQVAGAIARRCHEFGETPVDALAVLLKNPAPDTDWGVRLVLLPGT